MLRNDLTIHLLESVSRVYFIEHSERDKTHNN